MILIVPMSPVYYTPFSMAIVLMLIAGGLASVANFFMRRSIDAGGSTRAYLVVQLFISFLVAIYLSPIRTGYYTPSGLSIALGLVAGLLLGAMMWSVGRSLEKGPVGLTFAFLNSATVMPAIVMAIVFGSVFGHIYSLWNGLGSALVVVGLFWAGWETKTTASKGQWATVVLAAFLFHVALLIMLQWRALLLQANLSHPFLPFSLEFTTSQWFFPMIFLAAVAIQLISYLHMEKRWPNAEEVLYGVLGGFVQGGATFCLVTAPEYATPVQNAMIFPLFAVTIIFLTNLWSQAIYKEKVNWLANSLCLAGIMVGTVDWTIVTRMLGR
jgi:drug/metabolite transporter (DMT)-like permease